MPISDSDPDVLVDTSVAIALMVSDHARHDSVLSALAGRRLGLSGHAAFEVFSVLTRLPPPARRTPAAVGQLLAANFAGSRFLNEAGAASLVEELAEAGIAGGSVYDALVGAAARSNRLGLITRDRRALDTYRALGVDVELLY
ncbi:MAG: type II toxin-antitoxin system VapC family toxin [Acidimicrobiales bacterium]